MEPLTSRTLHIVIDMQRLFAEPTAWHTPALHQIVPAVTAITERHRARTLFSRFTTPSRAETAQGRWRRYYQRWSDVTTDRLDSDFFNLIPSLAELAEPGMTFDKTTFSIFGSPQMQARLAIESVDTLVMTGVETDVCVLASVLDAVDRGYRVVVPVDAVTSSDAATHDAVIKHVLPRFADQVDLGDTAQVLAAWARG